MGPTSLIIDPPMQLWCLILKKFIECVLCMLDTKVLILSKKVQAQDVAQGDVLQKVLSTISTKTNCEVRFNIIIDNNGFCTISCAIWSLIMHLVHINLIFKGTIKKLIHLFRECFN